MRILHTSDWHIGRTFHGVDLLADQECSLLAIAELVSAEAVDVVVLPGDVYDRSIPGADAIAVCNRGFEAIRAAGATIVATSGNHDSPTRLGALGSFAAAGGLHLRCRIADVDQPVLLDDEFGAVAFYGIPYLEPEITRVELGVPQARSHAEILDAAMSRVRAELAGRPGVRTVVLAHAFVVGGEATGSERSISVGGVETVPMSAFDGIDYVALGHLHSPQTLSDSVRYSGSPLPYSFGECSHRKAVWIIDLDASGLAEVRRHDLPIVRGLSQLTGALDDLLADPEHAGAENHYVSATLTDHARPIDSLRRLRDRFPHAVHVEWQRPEGNPELRYRERVRGRRDTEIAESFLTDVRGTPTPGEMTWLERALGVAAREQDGPRRAAAVAKQEPVAAAIQAGDGESTSAAVRRQPEFASENDESDAVAAATVGYAASPITATGDAAESVSEVRRASAGAVDQPAMDSRAMDLDPDVPAGEHVGGVDAVAADNAVNEVDASAAAGAVGESDAATADSPVDGSELPAARSDTDAETAVSEALVEEDALFSADAVASVDAVVSPEAVGRGSDEAVRVVRAAGFDGSARGADAAEADEALGLFDLEEFGVGRGEESGGDAAGVSA